MASSFKDALEKTESGKVLIINFVSREEKRRLHKNTYKVAKKVKEVYSDAIAMRIKKLNDTAHQMIVKESRYLPTSHRFKIFKMAKPIITKLGIKGGQEYKEALSVLKLITVTSSECSPRKAFNLAVKPLLK